jgi:hypothetical protein
VHPDVIEKSKVVDVGNVFSRPAGEAAERYG